MISIIICSRYKKISSKIQQNIDNTIGKIEYEIIWIDNSLNTYSIYSAYKEGVNKAQYPFLCFMHEDLVFHSNNWGNILIEELSDYNIGLVGTMGGYYLDHYSIYWTVKTLMRGSLVHPNSKQQIARCNDHSELGNYVVAIDGLWMGARKDLFINELYWDTETYDGFHFYDMDISLQAFTKGYKIKVIDNIFIEHQTRGIVNESFYRNCVKFHKKWDSFMPIMSTNIPEAYIQDAKHIQLEQRCQNEIFKYQTQKLLSRFPYKIISKIYHFLGINIW